MRIGFIGLGLLGLPRALAVASRGYRVRGFDTNPERMRIDWYPPRERGIGGESLAALAARVDFRFASLDAVVGESEIVFIGVQTPSQGRYDGSGPFPDGGVEYDLEPLSRAIDEVAAAAVRSTPGRRVLAVVSTVLPGTVSALAERVAHIPGLALAHTPEFSAVGSIIRDCLDPEFVLVGAADQATGTALESFYRTLSDAPVFVTNFENAELIKTTYNGFIGVKIAFANALMEIAHKTPGCDVDVVSDCLALATRRLLSPRYLRGGLGDGGGCHPKENAALAVLARRLDLSFDPFTTNMTARDRQTDWLASLVADEHGRTGLPIWILGTAFKADISVEVGSPALLLHDALRRRRLAVAMHDPLVPGREDPPPATPALYVLGAPHAVLKSFAAVAGSVVIDPWNHVTDRDGVRTIRVGRAMRPA